MPDHSDHTRTRDTDPRARSDDRSAKTDVAKTDKATTDKAQRPPASEDQIDEALEETFPASDPIAPSRIDGPKT